MNLAADMLFHTVDVRRKYISLDFSLLLSSPSDKMPRSQTRSESRTRETSEEPPTTMDPPEATAEIVTYTTHTHGSFIEISHAPEKGKDVEVHRRRDGADRRQVRHALHQQVEPRGLHLLRGDGQQEVRSEAVQDLHRDGGDDGRGPRHRREEQEEDPGGHDEVQGEALVQQRVDLLQERHLPVHPGGGGPASRSSRRGSGCR
jgi:hypothetical protein